MNAKFESLSSPKSSREFLIRTDEDTCGFGRFAPRWLQKYADPKAYFFVFSILGVLQGAYFTYLIGVVSSLEKRYAFSSQVTGLILIADTLSPIFFSLFIGYFGGKSHKPRLISTCMLLVVLSCFLSAFPYFMYGPGIHILSKSSGFMQKPVREYCGLNSSETVCETEANPDFTAVAILFVASFLNGFGHTAFYVIGMPYLDDNVKKKNSPMYFGAMGALRVFGPVLGFLLSSFCLKFYEDPFYDPGIDLNNPRWVGAWWMGFLILGVILLFFTLLLSLFPRRLPKRFRSEKTSKEKAEEEQSKPPPKLKDFPQEFRRLMKNPILVCHVISITFQVNGFAGYFVFMPKFMESQYQTSASDASLFSGTTGILSMLLGILLGGFVIMKYKPRPRYLTGYMVLVEIFSVLGLLISIFLGCPPVSMPVTHFNTDETLNLYNECNVGCSCTRRVFEPVCGADGTSTFFSPCFAGCPNLTGILSAAVTSNISAISNKTVFEDCRCVAGLNDTFATSSVTSGFCDSGCQMFMAYIIMLCVSKFISSTARVGNTLITFRCVEAKDKSFALGAFGSVLAMFAFIPYPLIYGALTDSACLVWEETCSKTGNCWLYDSDKFRLYLHGMSILLISIGICFDGIVFLLSDRMKNFYGEEDDDKRPGEDRIARWLKEEEEEDIIFTKFPKKKSLELDPVM